MKLKKTLTIFVAALIAVSLSSCSNGEKIDNTDVTRIETIIEDKSADITQKTSENTFAAKEKNTVSSFIYNSETDIVATESVSADNPMVWTKAEIIEFYKKAAEKSDNSVKSEKTINMKNVSINNGQYEGVIDFVMPIMTKLLANNSTEEDGITGGYNNLTEADVGVAKAYAAGDKTAIELTLINQTDGAKSDPMSGSVGHAITTVGDISAVTKQLNDLGLPIQLSDKDTSIDYTNAVVRVLVDKDGYIVKGTWSYTVEIRMNNYKVGNSKVDTTSVVMDNIITVNGGF